MIIGYLDPWGHGNGPKRQIAYIPGVWGSGSRDV